MVNAEYNAETAQSIGQMLVAYAEMKDALGCVSKTKTNPDLCRQESAIHREAICRAVAIAQRAFEEYTRLVPLNIRMTVPLWDDRLMSKFEKDLSSKVM